MKERILELYQKIASEEKKLLMRWVSREYKEEVFLAFGQKENPEDSQLSEGDLRHFAKVLSGFANSVGGIYVLGISTIEDEGIAKVHQLDPIEGIDAVKQQLMDSVAHLISPSDLHIECSVFYDPQFSEGVGYLVVYVDAYPTPPVMNISFSQNNYWKRSRQGFAQLEHYEINDLYGRRLRPELKLEYAFDTIQGDPNYHNFRALFGLSNHGTGIARFPYLFVKNYSPEYIHPTMRFGPLDGQKTTGLIDTPLPYDSQETIGYLKQYTGGIDHVIHPKCTLWVFAVPFSIRKEGFSNTIPKLEFDFFADFELGSMDKVKETQELVIRRYDLYSQLEALMQDQLTTE